MYDFQIIKRALLIALSLYRSLLSYFYFYFLTSIYIATLFHIFFFAVKRVYSSFI